VYVITSRQEQENSPDVVIGMIKVFTFDVYALRDPSTSLSFMTPYITMRFDILPERLFEPFDLSTPVSGSIELIEFIVIVPFLSIARTSWLN